MIALLASFDVGSREVEDLAATEPPPPPLLLLFSLLLLLFLFLHQPHPPPSVLILLQTCGLWRDSTFTSNRSVSKLRQNSTTSRPRQ
ncbi:hypothetical protein E2C01_014226 [Portunus trituberculatus]|uniref:Uncharacterized protein n=1 Tax=Portunus trituberculatus TaxID=210409 RepID=A0A5B7DIL5_PORTR|nr:hypothetical protein [Portunus trituberculatus]